MTTNKALLEQAMCEVYEGITGKCWHKWALAGDHAYLELQCNKCKAWESERNHNPRLANSLDAWRPLWEAMTDEQLKTHDWILIRDYVEHGHIKYIWQATPLHHLEAALRMLDKWTKEMEN